MNLFDLAGTRFDREEFRDLIPDQGVKIERIVSRGHTTPDGEWYDQDRDEWVVVLEGRATLEWEDGRRRDLGRGDSVLLPAHERHRVAATSSDPPVIWLAVHGPLVPAAEGRPADG